MNITFLAVLNRLPLGIRYGASGVWVGTRFVASEEAGANKTHKQMVLSAGYDDVSRTLIYSGRPMSVRKTPYVNAWFVDFFPFIIFFSVNISLR